MKKSLSINTLLYAYSFRKVKDSENQEAPIDALCHVNFNALSCNRARIVRSTIKPILENYFVVFNEKQKHKEKICLEITDKHNKRIELLKALPDSEVDYDEINSTLQKDLFNAEEKINKEIEELQQEEYEIDFKPIKLSSFMIDPCGDQDDIKNWHNFSGDNLDFLDWLIINDLDKSDVKKQDEIETIKK